MPVNGLCKALALDCLRSAMRDGGARPDGPVRHGAAKRRSGRESGGCLEASMQPQGRICRKRSKRKATGAGTRGLETSRHQGREANPPRHRNSGERRRQAGERQASDGGKQGPGEEECKAWKGGHSRRMKEESGRPDLAGCPCGPIDAQVQGGRVSGERRRQGPRGRLRRAKAREPRQQAARPTCPGMETQWSSADGQARGGTDSGRGTERGGPGQGRKGFKMRGSGVAMCKGAGRKGRGSQRQGAGAPTAAAAHHRHLPACHPGC